MGVASTRVAVWCISDRAPGEIEIELQRKAASVTVAEDVYCCWNVETIASPVQKW